jgi:hypothetical protein
MKVDLTEGSSDLTGKMREYLGEKKYSIDGRLDLTKGSLMG